MEEGHAVDCRFLDLESCCSGTGGAKAAQCAQQRKSAERGPYRVLCLAHPKRQTSGDIDNAFLIVQNAQQDSQLPWNSAVPFIATPDATLSPTGGWQGLPSLEGFTLNRSWEIVPGAIMPFYMTAGLEAINVRRAVICWPGKPRDSWRYANLYRNALSIVEANTTSGVEKGTVLIVAPGGYRRQVVGTRCSTSSRQPGSTTLISNPARCWKTSSFSTAVPGRLEVCPVVLPSTTSSRRTRSWTTSQTCFLTGQCTQT